MLIEVLDQPLIRATKECHADKNFFSFYKFFYKPKFIQFFFFKSKTRNSNDCKGMRKLKNYQVWPI